MARVAQLPGAAPVPPQNLEAEESVLGAMMLSPNAIDTVTDVLDASDFYRESHAKIFRAARDLYTRGEPVDAITLVDSLEERGELEDVGGKTRLHELAALVPASANVGHYALIVREMATLRGLVRAGTEISRLGWERPGAAPDLVDRAEQVVFELKDGFERITQLYEAGVDITGTPTGFRDLDRLTSGFQEGNLVIAAARPSMGKSALAICIAANLGVRFGIPVAIFTLEMSKSEVTQRLMCSEAKVESQRLRTGKLAPDDWPRLTAACDRLMKAPIYVDDTSSVTMMEIRSKSRRLKSKEPKLGLVIVDYLQLMTSGASVENRVQEVSQISRSLKLLARDLDVPVLALSQLSRAVEQRHDKRPILSDLRESGCLAGDSLVYLPDEGVRRPIRELVGRTGVRVLAVNTETWRLEPRRVARAFATGRKPVYRLTTRLGRTIRATGNHKFLAFDGWRRLDDMFPGLRIAVPRALPGPDRQTLGNSDLALLGHLVGGDCAVTPDAVRVTARDRHCAATVAILAVDLFGESLSPRIDPDDGRYRVDLAGRSPHRNPVAEWLDRLGALAPARRHRRVPDEVFRQPPEAIALFLRHLWARTGRIRAGNGRSYPIVRFDSLGERLADDLCTLLLRLGLTAVRRRQPPSLQGGAFRVDVTGSTDLERFLAFAGGVGGLRARHAASMRDRIREWTPGSGPEWLPAEAWRTIVVPALNPAAITTRTDQSRIGARLSAARGSIAPVEDPVAAEELRLLATSDVHWDEIVAIEHDGVEEVYDLTVDGLHNFVADSVIVHNSLEQDADLVLFIYRDEHYNPEDSPDKGLAELILSKHRNGPTGSEKLSFLSRYAKFADLAQH
jgi:replicative DNA helicase